MNTIVDLTTAVDCIVKRAGELGLLREDNVFEVNDALDEITALRAEMERLRSYVHEGVWIVLDSPCDDLRAELEKHREAFERRE